MYSKKTIISCIFLLAFSCSVLSQADFVNSAVGDFGAPASSVEAYADSDLDIQTLKLEQKAELTLGVELPSLFLDSEPLAFDFKPNGENQLIMIYPLRYSSWKIGKFNQELIRAGFCPKAVVNMKERAWYAPMSLAKKQIQKGIDASPDIRCNVAIDHEGYIKQTWGLEKGAVILVVDGAGHIKHLEYGIPNKKEKALIIEKLKS